MRNNRQKFHNFIEVLNDNKTDSLDVKTIKHIIQKFQYKLKIIYKVPKEFRSAIDLQSRSAYLPEAAYLGPVDKILFFSKKSDFDKESYYFLLLHEMLHSTGAQNRLNRALFQYTLKQWEEMDKTSYKKKYKLLFHEEIIVLFATIMLFDKFSLCSKLVAQKISSFMEKLNLDFNSRIIYKDFCQAQEIVEHVLKP